MILLSMLSGCYTVMRTSTQTEVPPENPEETAVDPSSLWLAYYETETPWWEETRSENDTAAAMLPYASCSGKAANTISGVIGAKVPAQHAHTLTIDILTAKSVAL